VKKTLHALAISICAFTLFAGCSDKQESPAAVDKNQSITTESTILFDKKQKPTPTQVGPIRWNAKSNKISLPFKASTPLGIESINLDVEHHGMSAGMIDLRAVYGDGTFPLPIARTSDDACLDEYGLLNDECFADIALYDFNKDGIPEIVLSVGDGSIEQKVYIIQYHPPAMKEDRFRSENWTSMTLDGQSDCYISGDSISFRVGSRGFTDTYFFREGKFYFKGFN
jgi:hypothetical protein